MNPIEGFLNGQQLEGFGNCLLNTYHLFLLAYHVNEATHLSGCGSITSY